MPMNTQVVIKPTMGDFLRDRYETARATVRREQRRNYSQNEYAKDVGVVPQTFSRYINGDTGMTLDNAVILLVAFGPDILPHFDFSAGILDDDSAYILSMLPRMTEEEREEAMTHFKPSKKAPGVVSNGALQTT